MLAVSQVREFFFPIMKLAEKKGIQLDVVYKGEIYLLTVDRTYKKYTYPKVLRPNARKPAIKLSTKDCPKCGGLMVGKNCIHQKCGYELPS